MSDAQESTAAAATAAPASPRGPKPPPEGIVPIFLRGVTCEKFGLKTGEGVMDLVNFKYIVRDEILKEVQLMGVMSDFEPAKKHLEAFKGPEILIVVDKDGTYGETFLLCVTEEAQEQFFKIANDKADAEAAKLRAAEDAEAARKAAEWARANAVYEDVPIVPRPWVSATSEETENEINTISHYTPREPIRLEVVRPKRAVNQPYRFLDRNAEVGGIHESRSHKDPHYVYIKENDIAIQAAPILTSSAGQTTWYRPVNKAVQCETSTSTEAVPDDAKDEFLAFLERTVVRVEQALDDCDTVNLFNETFQLTGDEEAGDSSVAENELRELKNFADPNYSKMKMITCIDWMPKANGMVAVNAVRNMSLDQLAHIAGVTYTSYLLVWDFRQLIRPSMLMCSPYEIELFRFNPNAPHLVVGGCATGQVLLWDISETARKSDAKGMNSLFEDADVSSSSSIPIIPKYISSVDHSHKGAVSDIFWLPPTTQINYRGRLVPQEHLDGNSYQFITISFDAQVLVWDIRFELIAQDQLRHIGKMKHIQFEKVDKSHKEGSNGVGRPLWSPVFRAGLKRLEGVGELSLCKVSCSGTLKQSIYSKTQLPGDPRSHLILATEEGDLMFADICGRKAESSAARDDDEEEGGGDASRELLKWMVADHVRPCVALQQSPHFADIVLTVSDMKFNIWKVIDGSIHIITHYFIIIYLFFLIHKCRLVTKSLYFPRLFLSRTSRVRAGRPPVPPWSYSPRTTARCTCGTSRTRAPSPRWSSRRCIRASLPWSS